MPNEIDPNNREYDLAEFRFKEQKVYANSIEVSHEKDGGDEKTVTNSNKPLRYGRTLKKRTWSASDILPESYHIMMKYYESGELFPIKCFNFDEVGNENHEGTLTYAVVTKVTKKNGDDGPEIDAEGKALDFITP